VTILEIDAFSKEEKGNTSLLEKLQTRLRKFKMKRHSKSNITMSMIKKKAARFWSNQHIHEAPRWINSNR
jgi:hypothetical protein